MNKPDYLLSVAQGLKDIEWRAEPKQSAIQLIESNEGSRSGCLGSLTSNACAAALQTYFRNHNLQSLKQWSYVASKLAIMRMHLEMHANLETLFWALISDCPEMFAWWQRNQSFGQKPEKPQDLDNIKSDVYARIQTLRALNGEWDELIPACEQALASPESFKQVKPRLIQFRFYLALAKQDKSAMRDVILEMCSPKARSRSYQYESGLSNNFIVMIATLFAKLARLHGHVLDLDTPWIPKDWLPIAPNAQYDDPWPFMQSFDIWQPLPEPYAMYSPKRA